MLAALTPSFSDEVPVTPVSQSLTGSGTAASPYAVTTVASAHDPFASNPDLVFQITEVDTYVVGQSFYHSDVTVKNISSVDQNSTGALYHAADCQLRGSNTGFGSAEPPFGATVVGVACTRAASNDQVHERLVPLTPSGASVHRDHGFDVVAITFGRRQPPGRMRQLREQRRQRHSDPVVGVCSRCRGVPDRLVQHRDHRHRRRPAVSRSPAPPARPSAEPSPPSPTRTPAPPRARTPPRSTGATALPRRRARSPAPTGASPSPAPTPTPAPARSQSR